MHCMGIDIGTSGCKAVVFDNEGTPVAEAHREYDTIMPCPGTAELDSAEVLDACMQVMAESASACPSGDPVRAIGVSSQGEAFTAVGKDGQYLTNAMVSFDTRPAAVAEQWSASFGRDRLYQRTGHTAHPMFTLFKILWLRDNHPDLWDQTAHFYCFEELLHTRLGLEPAISYPLAGRTMLFNVQTHQWDPDILDAAGLDPEKLARALPAGAVVGKLPANVAAELNVAPETVVVAGGHDQPCGALGAGVVKPGRAMYGMGTVECICPAFPKAVFSNDLFRSNLCTYDFTALGMYTTVAFSLTGGNLLRWYRDEWAMPEVADAEKRGISPYDAILESMPGNPTDLIVLPHFTPTGTPHFDTDPTGAILGLTLNTRRGDVLRALLEGVTFEMKLNVEILEASGVHIEQFVATGGGARNPALTQLKADVLNRPITTVEVTEAGCLGVAMLGYSAVTSEPIQEVAGRWVHPTSDVKPNPEFAEQYSEAFQIYRKLYPTLKTLRPQGG